MIIKWIYPFCRPFRSSRPEVFCKKGVLKNCDKFTGKHFCQRLWHRCFPVNLSKFLRTPFLSNTSGSCFWPLYSALICTVFLFLFLYMLFRHMIWYNFSSFFSVHIECRDSQSVVYQSQHSLQKKKKFWNRCFCLLYGETLSHSIL